MLVLHDLCNVHDFTHCVINATRVISSSVYCVKFRVGWKTPYPFLLQLQNCPTTLFYRPVIFFVKRIWLSLHVCFVNTGSVVPPMSRVTFPMWLCYAWGWAGRAFVVWNPFPAIEENPGMFPQKNSFLFDWRKKDMNILDDVEVSKLLRNFYSESELIL